MRPWEQAGTWFSFKKTIKETRLSLLFYLVPTHKELLVSIIKKGRWRCLRAAAKLLWTSLQLSKVCSGLYLYFHCSSHSVQAKNPSVTNDSLINDSKVKAVVALVDEAFHHQGASATQLSPSRCPQRWRRAQADLWPQTRTMAFSVQHCPWEFIELLYNLTFALSILLLSICLFIA